MIRPCDWPFQTKVIVFVISFYNISFYSFGHHYYRSQPVTKPVSHSVTISRVFARYAFVENLRREARVKLTQSSYKAHCKVSCKPGESSGSSSEI